MGKYRADEAEWLTLRLVDPNDISRVRVYWCLCRPTPPGAISGRASTDINKPAAS